MFDPAEGQPVELDARSPTRYRWAVESEPFPINWDALLMKDRWKERLIDPNEEYPFRSQAEIETIGRPERLPVTADGHCLVAEMVWRYAKDVGLTITESWRESYGKWG